MQWDQALAPVPSLPLWTAPSSHEPKQTSPSLGCFCPAFCHSNGKAAAILPLLNATETFSVLTHGGCSTSKVSPEGSFVKDLFPS